ARARAAARPRGRPPHRANHARRVRRQARLAVSRALSPGRTGLARRRVGRLREQAAREVLQADARRAPAAAGRDGKLAAHRPRDRARARGHVVAMAGARLAALLRNLLMRDRAERALDEDVRAYL